MKEVLKAVRDWLMDDDVLTGMLASYAGAPAIFTGDYVPRDATPPYLIITTKAVLDVSTKTDVMVEQWIGVEVWSKGGYSVEEAERIADRVFTDFISPTLSVSGWEVLGSHPEPAEEIPSAEGWAGRLVQTKLVLLKGG